jgi:hypothetical protein
MAPLFAEFRFLLPLRFSAGSILARWDPVSHQNLPVFGVFEVFLICDQSTNTRKLLFYVLRDVSVE